MKKKTQRKIKKATKALRKTFKRAGGSLGIATGALTLGGFAAVAAFDPTVRERTQAFAGATRDFFRRLGRGTAERLTTDEHALEATTH